MKSFNIQELEAFTGIKEHTFRIWEKRYAFVIPKRTSTNLRTYSIEEVEMLLNIALLYAHGIRISDLALLTPIERDAKAKALCAIESIQQRIIFKLIIQMYAYEFDQFEATLDCYSKMTGIDDMINAILIPFMERIKLFSYLDQSSVIHVIVTIIRKKIIYALESINPTNNVNKSALLFLPLGEHFDLILLYLAYILKRKGWQVLYLGTNIGIENLQSVINIKVPDYMLTYQCCRKSIDMDSYYFYFQHLIPMSRFLIAESTERTSQLPKKNEKYFYFKDLSESLKDSA